jgi:hypothetical protein
MDARQLYGHSRRPAHTLGRATRALQQVRKPLPVQGHMQRNQQDKQLRCGGVYPIGVNLGT